MTNEQAKEIMKAYRDRLTSSCSNQLDKDIEAFNIAIDSIRPQGKWVKITKDGVMPIEYMCNNCWRTAKSYYEECLIEKVYPFCHCGADMRKGGKE